MPKRKANRKIENRGTALVRARKAAVVVRKERRYSESEHAIRRLQASGIIKIGTEKGEVVVSPTRKFHDKFVDVIRGLLRIRARERDGELLSDDDRDLLQTRDKMLRLVRAAKFGSVGLAGLDVQVAACVVFKEMASVDVMEDVALPLELVCTYYWAQEGLVEKLRELERAHGDDLEADAFWTRSRGRG